MQGGRGPPRRKRSVNVCSLDNETVESLKAQFAKVDKTESGSLSPSEVEQLIKESYAPTEAETNNVFQCLNVNEDGVVDLDEFVVSFYVIYKAFIREAGHAEVEFDSVYAEFTAELNYMAKRGKRGVSDDIVFSVEVLAEAKSVLPEEWITNLKEKFSACATSEELKLSRSDVVTLLKTIFCPSQAKIDMVMGFFAMTGGTEAITSENFINGMTLLYGDLGQLAVSPSVKANSPMGSPVRDSTEEEQSGSPKVNLGA